MKRLTIWWTFVLVTGLLGAGMATAQTSGLLDPPPASVCASQVVPTTPGDVHMFPGRWWNPERNGLGWDFFYGDGQQAMYLTWFTFDRAGRPVWLHGNAADLQFNGATGERTWQSTLHWIEWNPQGQRREIPVGKVSVRFPYLTTTRAAVRWTWNEGPDKVGDGVYDECLFDMFRGLVNPNEEVPANLNQAFSSNWFYRADVPNHPLLGWGVDLLIDIVDGTYVETATAAIFDRSNRPVWVQSTDTWGSAPPPTDTFAQNHRAVMRYLRYTNTSKHPALTACKFPAVCTDVRFPGVENGVATSYFQRAMTDAKYGNMALAVKVPGSVTGQDPATSGAPIDWPPTQATVGQTTPFPNPVPVTRVDSDHVIVNQTLCRVAEQTATCDFVVSWASADANATVVRLNLNNNANTDKEIGRGTSGVYTDNLKVGERVQYLISYVNANQQLVRHRTPEVRVVLKDILADIDPGIDPVDCAKGPGCDLGRHDAGAGTMAGEPGVDGGSAKYTIPIVVPPGRKGVQPEVALSYSSGSGNGVAGLGWSLSAASVIQRCSQTLAQDGVARPVRLDGQDRLCLDGQRLVPVNPKATYGAAGTVYRTEIDSFRRVRQLGTETLGMTGVCFQVQEKDGRVLTYGCKGLASGCPVPANTNVEPTTTPAGTALEQSWLLSRVEDRSGNHMDFCYREFGDGETLLDQIVYTGDRATAGTRAVAFTYEGRPNSAGANDWSSSFVNGALTLQTQRLTKIETFIKVAGATRQPIRSYVLHYEDPDTQLTHSWYSGRSLLHSVQECAHEGGLACRQPTLVEWADGPLNFQAGPLNIAGIPNSTQDEGTIEFVDSDEVADLVIPPRLDRRLSAMADYDGDGTREVIITQRGSDGLPHQYLGKFDADRNFQGAVEITDASLRATKDLITSALSVSADIDGDGKAEELTGSVIHKWKLGRGASVSATTPFATIATNLPAYSEASVADFNADGAVDVVVKTAYGCSGTPNPSKSVYAELCLFLNPRTGPIAVNGSAPRYDFVAGGAITSLIRNANNMEQVQSVADFDGNGTADVIVGDDYGPVRVHLTTLTGTTLTFPSRDRTQMRVWQYVDSQASPRWMDVTGDGLVDLVIARNESCAGATAPCYGNWNIQVNRGDGTLADKASVSYGPGAFAGSPGLIMTGGSMRYAGKMQQADVDADGRPDLLYPAKFAARICTKTQMRCGLWSGGAGQECTGGGPHNIVGHQLGWACPETPPEDSQWSDAQADLDNAYLGDQVTGAYQQGVGFTDHSIYRMNAIRFVQTGTNAFSLQVTETPLLSSTFNGEGRGNSFDDLYGDGLSDLIEETLACPVRGVPGTAFEHATCKVISGSRLGPDVDLPGGIPVACLSHPQYRPANCALADVGYLNENLGDHARLSTSGGRIAPAFPELVNSITNGVGDKTRWEYFPLSSKADRFSAMVPLYTLPAEGYADPNHFYFQSSMPVVASMTRSNGVGGELGLRSSRYGYEEAMFNTRGRGFQGFRRIVVESAPDAVSYSRRQRTATVFHQKFPLTGKVQSVETGRPGAGSSVLPVTQETVSYACNVDTRAVCDTANGTPPVHYPYVLEQESRTFDPFNNGAEIQRRTTRNFHSAQTKSGWDIYGNLLVQETSASDQFPGSKFVDSAVIRVENVYKAPDIANWWVDRLDSVTRTTFAVAYNGTHPLPDRAVNRDYVFTTHFVFNEDRTLQSTEIQKSATGNDRIQQYLYVVQGYPAGERNFGLPQSVETWAPKPSDPTLLTRLRHVVTHYDQDGYFPQTVFQYADHVGDEPNASIAHQTTTLYRDSDGQVSQSTAPSGLVTATSFDPFGQPTRIATYSRAGAPNLYAQPVSVATLPCRDGVCVGVGSGGLDSTGQAIDRRAVLRTTTAQNGAPTLVEWFDVLGRKIKTAKRGFDGQFIVQNTEYDSAGAVVRESVPFALTSDTARTTNYTRYGYDGLGRVLSKTVPATDPAASVVSTYSYTGNTTAIGIKSSVVQDCNFLPADSRNLCMSMSHTASVLGVARTVDAKNGVTRYWYDGAGQTIALSDPKVNKDVGAGVVPYRRAALMEYNALGHRIVMDDPNMGLWRFTYTPLGQLQQQTDARGFVTSVTARDLLGRVLEQTSEHILSNPGATATYETTRDIWSYDQSFRGSLDSVRRCVGGGRSVPACSESVSNFAYKWGEKYEYDPSTRVTASTATTRLEFPDTLHEETTRYFYDAFHGREKAIQYPAPSNLRVQTLYTRFGFPRDVINAETAERFWAIEAQDVWGNVTQQRFGNGIVGEYAASASTGQMLTRAWRDGVGPGTPAIDRIAYQYDVLGNLKQQTRSGGDIAGSVSETYVYDELQRLLSAGPLAPAPASTVYDYDEAGNFTRKSDFSLNEANAYGYPSQTSIAFPTSNVSAAACGRNVATSVRQAAGTATYACDANGNVVISNVPGSSPRTVIYDATNRPRRVQGFTGGTDFTYAPDGTRVLETITKNNVRSFLVRGKRGFERETVGTDINTAKLRHELGHAVVTFETTGQATAHTYTVRYRTVDHLGSPLGLMNGAGQFLEGATKTKLSFDAFGQARNADFSRRVDGGTYLQPVTRLGFTGHEHLEDAKLIHMNGRAFDYNLGRFLSVDPIIQFPTNGQSLNPYSYVLNNPFAGTDPTGFALENCTLGGTTCDLTNPQTTLKIHYEDGEYYAVAQDAEGNQIKAETITEVGSNGAKVTYELTQERLEKLYQQDPSAIEDLHSRGFSTKSVISGPNFMNHLAASHAQRFSGAMKDVAVDCFGKSIAGCVGSFVEELVLGDSLPEERGRFGSRYVPPPEGEFGGQPQKELPNDALVCRGGACKADNFLNGSGVVKEADDTLSGVSTQSRAGAPVSELARRFKNNQVGVSTAGEIRHAGGRVYADGTPNNPNHATINGLTAEKLEKLFTPTIPNPVPRDQRDDGRRDYD